MSVVGSDRPAWKIRPEMPNPYGYIFVLAEVDPASVTADVDGVEDVQIAPKHESVSAKRSLVHKEISALGGQLTMSAGVRSVCAFEAVLFDPISSDTRSAADDVARRGRYDSLVLIETTSPGAARSLLAGHDLDELLTVVARNSTFLKVVPVEKAKKIRSVDRQPGGVFLFNFLFADDATVLLNMWERTAQWWFTEGAMRNSELMVPLHLQASEYPAINNARWDDTGPAVKAFRNPGYWEFVVFNIDMDGVTAVPSLYRLAN
jgi:hypothetical protein